LRDAEKLKIRVQENEMSDQLLMEVRTENEKLSKFQNSYKKLLKEKDKKLDQLRDAYESLQ